MKINVYHGGKDLKRFGDFVASSKKDRDQYGTGLYSTVRYEVAYKYSRGTRKMYALVLDCDPKHCTSLIRISFAKGEELINLLPVRMRKEYKEFVQRQIERGINDLRLSTLETFVINYSKRSHLHAQELNDFMVHCGGKYSLDSHIVRVHDFNIIDELHYPVPAGFESSERDLDELNKEVRRRMMSE